jgi:LmbE family N-acetylglucosaminyl deacetylase
MIILTVGAHPDDAELFCGGTLLKLIDRDPSLSIYTVVCSAGNSRSNDRVHEQELADQFLGVRKGFFLDFNDGEMIHNLKLVNELEKIIDNVQPDYIFAHSIWDTHQDHLAVAKAIKSANRQKRFNLITYPSYDLTMPFPSNCLVDVTDYFDRKLKLLSLFASQQNRWYFQKEAIVARANGFPFIGRAEKFNVDNLLLFEEL